MDANAPTAPETLDAEHVLRTLSRDCEIAWDLSDQDSISAMEIKANWDALVRARAMLLKRVEKLIANARR